MPQSVYLQPADLANYGVAGATTAQIAQASTLINGILARPEGLIWVPDANGNPAYMAGLDPVITYTGTAGISPGTNVAVTVTGGLPGQDLIGDVLILDRANTGLAEACVVSTINGQEITLQTVQFTHSADFTLDEGLAITQEVSLPQDRSIARISRWPMVNLLSGQGRYTYGRRSNQAEGYVEEFNLLAAVGNFGGPPLWIPFNIAATGLNNTTGELWVPAGVLLAYYSEVRLRYIAGWKAANLPSDIKQACANILTAMSQAPAGPAIKQLKAGDSSITFFGNTVIDRDTMRMLAPYKARLYA